MDGIHTARCLNFNQIIKKLRHVTYDTERDEMVQR